MKNALNSIEKQVKVLVEKRTWIRKELEKFLKNWVEKTEGIEIFSPVDVEYHDLQVFFATGRYKFVCIDDDHTVFEPFDAYIEDLDFNVVKRFISDLPEIIKDIQAQLENENSSDAETLDFLKGLNK